MYEHFVHSPVTLDPGSDFWAPGPSWVNAQTWCERFLLPQVFAAQAWGWKHRSAHPQSQSGIPGIRCCHIPGSLQRPSDAPVVGKRESGSLNWKLTFYDQYNGKRDQQLYINITIYPVHIRHWHNPVLYPLKRITSHISMTSGVCAFSFRPLFWHASSPAFFFFLLFVHPFSPIGLKAFLAP